MKNSNRYHTPQKIFISALVCITVSVAAVALRAVAASNVNDVRTQSRETQQEIVRTKAQIEDNESKVRQTVAEIESLEADIQTNRETVERMAEQVGTLDKKIGYLSANIAAGERELGRLREEYGRAVRKMRRARGRYSTLSFIFASANFNQALRRLRYLHEFDTWRERQTERIDRMLASLGSEKRELGDSRRDKDYALSVSRNAQRELQTQHARQNELAAQLEREGDALRVYLAEKQKEADRLNATISSLIAQEEARKEADRVAREAKAEADRKARAAKAEADRKAREAQAEADRKAREAKAEADRKAREAKAEADRKAREAKEAKERQAKAEADRKVREAKAEADRKAREAKAEAERKEREAKQAQEEARRLEREAAQTGADYARARNRAPREKPNPPVTNPSSVSNSSAGGDSFAAMKGKLPRPCDGSFRIISSFGRHPLPDLPTVQYDNPGIDAEVSAGAHAKAVFSGSVSGVYTVPGYNTVVIVNHGTYYTVYGNIAKAAVKTGDKVKAGQSLGALARDPDNSKRTTIHFEVWYNRTKENPAVWIR